MTAFAGIVTFDGAPIDLRREDRAGADIAATRSGYLSFVADARLDNRAELGAALGLSTPELARTSDGELLLQMYERWGEAGIARCLGAFVFALWDAQARRLIFGRDCLGNRVLFFHRGKGFVAFATTLRALLAMPQVPRELDEAALASFLAVNLTEPVRTFYRGIDRVPTRTLVTIDRDTIGHRYYWSPDLDAPSPFRRDEDYIERARELFDQAVGAAMQDTPHLAISVSGGLDSSAIAATAARLGGAKSITCYAMVPPANARIEIASRYLDERDKVEALARMYPALDVRFLSAESPHPYEEDVTRFFARAHMPVLGPTILEQHAHLHDAVAAEHRSLLVGNLGNFGLSWHGRFSILALLRNGEWAAAVHELRATARADGRGLVRTFAKDVLMPAAPGWLRRSIHRLRGRDPYSVARYSALNPAYIAEHDLVDRWQADGFDPWAKPGGWHPARHRARFLFDLNQPGRDYKAMSAELRGYELRDPHGDRRLLEFLLTVPEPMYRRDGVARSFARAVLADRLPREILDERRRGALGVNWFRHLDARRHDIASEIERLEASPLAHRLIDLPRLKRLMDQWPADEHAAEKSKFDYRSVLSRGLHVGRFIRWVEGGNA